MIRFVSPGFHRQAGAAAVAWKAGHEVVYTNGLLSDGAGERLVPHHSDAAHNRETSMQVKKVSH
jgi:hypothetical protein